MSTIRDVARIAGVSISTVSLTLNDPDRVSAETKRKVADAAREVGYTANPIAQSLKRGKSRLIGMVVADITNPFFGKLKNRQRPTQYFAMYFNASPKGDLADARAR